MMNRQGQQTVTIYSQRRESRVFEERLVQQVREQTFEEDIRQ